MHTEEFNAIVLDQIETQKEVLIKKAGEYATDDDRLHNFRVGAQLTGQTMRAALAGMMLKHTTSVYDMLYAEDDTFPMEMWREKVGDHINYLFLALAVVIEEKGLVGQEDLIAHYEHEIERLKKELSDQDQDVEQDVMDESINESPAVLSRKEMEETLVESSNPETKKMPTFLQTL